MQFIFYESTLNKNREKHQSHSFGLKRNNEIKLKEHIICFEYKAEQKKKKWLFESPFILNIIQLLISKLTMKGFFPA